MGTRDFDFLFVLSFLIIILICIRLDHLLLLLMITQHSTCSCAAMPSRLLTTAAWCASRSTAFHTSSPCTSSWA